MNKDKKFMAFGLISVYFIIGIIILINYPNNSEMILKQNYIVDTIAYFFMTGIFIIEFTKSEMGILDPIVFISVIYILMFSIAPIIDIINGEVFWFGVNVFQYGVKGTIVAVIGYFMFFIGYTIPLKKVTKETKLNFIHYDNNKISRVCIFIWTICFILSFIYLSAAGGVNLTYILTLGLKGSKDISSISATPLGVVSMFSYSLVSTCLIYNYYGKSKAMKIIISFATFMIQMIRGFRFIVMILLVAHFYMYYIKKDKRPSIQIIIIVATVCCILIGLMGFYRNALRVGQAIDFSKFEVKHITDALIGNLGIYKTYYSIMGIVPTNVPYMYGSQMIIYTLIMFIPRAIWPSKPSPNGIEAIKVGLGEYAAQAGQAYPGIGEYYYEFGIIGVIFFMWLFGYCIRKVKSNYLKDKRDFHTMCVYSIIIPTTLQLIIRGYTPSNFYLVLFLVMPIIIIRKFSKLSIINDKKDINKKIL